MEKDQKVQKFKKFRFFLLNFFPSGKKKFKKFRFFLLNFFPPGKKNQKVPGSLVDFFHYKKFQKFKCDLCEHLKVSSWQAKTKNKQN